MDITFNTSVIDISVALNALKLYKNKDYKEAINVLLQILDTEPRNWDARLMLGACYYKTAQYGAAARVFTFLGENCPVEEIKSKAYQGLLSANNKVGYGPKPHPEFGGPVGENVAVHWMD